MANGNEADQAMFAPILKEFRQQWEIDVLFVADAALYCEENIAQMDSPLLFQARLSMAYLHGRSTSIPVNVN